MLVLLDDDHCYRAIQSRDPRFDGWFVTAVRTTGIYCRPSCPAITPLRRNVEFFRAAATAQAHGYRACKRCRPDASPGSPEWNSRADVVGRAMRLIADGLVDRDGVSGLAGRLGYSERQVNRLLVAEVGSSPLALARAQRAQTARILIETTNLPITDVAFAAGFQSVRQFNDTVREVYAASPTTLRAAKSPNPAGGPLTVRLACREPFDGDSLLGFLAVRAVPGVEAVEGDDLSPLAAPRPGLGVVSITVHGASVTCAPALDDLADVQAAVQRTRRLLDLDCDPATIRDHLGSDPMLAALLEKRPGLRAPAIPTARSCWCAPCWASRSASPVLARSPARLVAAHGEPLAAAVGGVTHVFPSAATIAGLSPQDFAMPRARGAALIDACAKVADGTIVLDAGSDRAEARVALEAVKGIGPWTAGYVAMRALGDPDVFLPTDIGVRHALEALGADSNPRSAAALAEAWRPWRSYALHHLWASL